MSSFVKNVVLVCHATFFLFFWEMGCIFSLFYDVFRRITTQKQLFLAGLGDSVALEMKYFSAYATFLDFGDNLRCMKQVACSLVRQVISQSVAPCHLAGRAHSVTGCRPIKRQTPTASYVSELPTKQREFVFLHGL